MTSSHGGAIVGISFSGEIRRAGKNSTYRYEEEVEAETLARQGSSACFPSPPKARRRWRRRRFASADHGRDDLEQ